MRFSAVSTSRTAEPRREDFIFPIPVPGRVAFVTGRDSEIGAPQTLVASLDDALALIGRRIPTLDTALIVLTRLDESPLQSHHRERLWRAFEVPVFEQLQDADGFVIARECEIHSGLHLDPSVPHPDLSRFETVEGYCDCGSEAPRLIALARPKRAAAAAAAG